MACKDRDRRFCCFILSSVICLSSIIKVMGTTENDNKFYNFINMENNDLEDKEHWIIIALFVSIAILSIIFEAILNNLSRWLKHNNLDSLNSMLNCLYKELTILGFITLVLFTLANTGFVQMLNDKIFGVSKTEAVAIEEMNLHGKLGTPPTVLKEIFEEVHIFIFLIMGIFILQAAALTISGLQIIKKFQFLEEKNEDELCNEIEMDSFQPNHELENMLSYYGIKKRFNNPLIPILTSPTYVRDSRYQFPLVSYLKQKTGEFLTELVELPVSSLGALIAIVILLRPIMDANPIQGIIFMIFVAFCLMISSAVLVLYFQHMENYIKPDMDDVIQFMVHKPNSEEFFSLSAPIDSVPMRRSNCFGDICNRTEQLFPFGKPLYSKRIIQIFLFFHAIYIAVLIGNVTTISHNSRHIWWRHGMWAYPLTIIPLLLSFYFWPTIINKFVMVSSLDCLVDYKTVKLVEEEFYKNEKYREWQILRFCLHKSEKIPFLNPEKIDFNVNTLKESNDNLRVEISQLFTTMRENVDVWYHSEYPGVVSLEAVLDVASSIYNYGEKKEDIEFLIKDWFKLFDVEKSGYVDYDGFFVIMIYFTRNLKNETEDSFKKRIDGIFRNRGNINHGEFRDVCKGINPPLTDKEISKLFDQMRKGHHIVTCDLIKEWAVNVLIENELIQ